MEQGVKVQSPQPEHLARGRSTGWGHGVLLLALPHCKATGSTTKASTPQPGPPGSATAPLLNLIPLSKTAAP